MDDTTSTSGGEEVPPAASVPSGPDEFCRNCGAPITGMRYCKDCGTAAGSETRHRGDIEVGAVEPGGRLTVSRKGVITVTIIVVIVVGIAAAVWAFMGRATETTHTIKGEMTLIDSDSFSGRKVGQPCSGSGGYRDISTGATVIVKDQDGTVIGSSSLESGKIGDEILYGCVFPFEVKGVKDASFFQVEVSRRGGISYSKGDMEKNDWTVQPSLGS